MKKRVLIILFTFLIGIVFTQAQENSTQLTFITNESFIVNDSHIKILIDYDFRSILNNEKYKNIQPPFDNIDIISISHIHDDHFNKDLTANYLNKNNSCNVFMPTEVFESFKSKIENESVNGRITVLNQKNYECEDNVISDNSYKHIKVPHAAGFSDMQNLIFIFKSGNIKFLHSGDYWGDNINSIRCNLLSEKIDVAMIHVEFLTKQDLYSGIEMIKKYINPEFIILMHIPQGSARMTEALNAKNELKEKFPNIHVFVDEMQTIKIKKVDNMIEME